jgi:hypothetical protein
VGDPFGQWGRGALTECGSSTAACAGGGTPPAAGRRSSGGRQLRGRGAAVSLGGGRGGEGGPGEWSEWLVRVAASTVEEGDGLLGWRRLKEVAVVDDVVARGR